jgi:hypothetical protein
MVLHAALFAALFAVLASAALPGALHLLRLPLLVVTAAGIPACAALLVRRAALRELRFLSVPDDYVSNLAVAAFLAATAAFLAGAIGAGALQIAAALLLLYLPLGKLRHALFFWLARGDLAWRLGLRGVYPPPAAEGDGGRD